MKACYSDYCESINRILKSQAEFTEYTNKAFYCEVFNWLKQVEGEDKRISLYNNLMDAYSLRVETLSKLICSSEKLLEKCRTKNKICAKRIGLGIYILEKLMFVSKVCGKSNMYFLIYNQNTNCVVLGKYTEQYDCESIPTNYYILD